MGCISFYRCVHSDRRLRYTVFNYKSYYITLHTAVLWAINTAGDSHILYEYLNVISVMSLFYELYNILCYCILNLFCTFHTQRAPIHSFTNENQWFFLFFTVLTEHRYQYIILHSYVCIFPFAFRAIYVAIVLEECNDQMLSAAKTNFSIRIFFLCKIYYEYSWTVVFKNLTT